MHKALFGHFVALGPPKNVNFPNYFRKNAKCLFVSSLRKACEEKFAHKYRVELQLDNTFHVLKPFSAHIFIRYILITDQQGNYCKSHPYLKYYQEEIRKRFVNCFFYSMLKSAKFIPELVAQGINFSRLLCLGNSRYTMYSVCLLYAWLQLINVVFRPLPTIVD